ncbi:hypothetical protein MNBD_GAMMA11-2997 [hydrothermal vent metagenome]|uniref:Uncharacterized protein n=1 Tax=hydrothermal vent metagenome TaxID=652676 RepID=A0A3B0X4I8_9ZZZZ
MKKILLKNIILAFVLISGIEMANALPVSEFTGRFEFYEQGELLFTDTKVAGVFDIDNGQGFFESSVDFQGASWRADIAEMIQWTGVSGSGAIEEKRFSWNTETWLVNNVQFECRVSFELDGCVAYRDSGGELLSSEQSSYSFSLSEGQFAGGVFIDWGEYTDIPVLSAMQIISLEGNILTVGSIDTDFDGIPGTALLDAPFLGATWSFDGQQDFSVVPVPGAVWLFISGFAGLMLTGLKRKQT